MMLRIVFASLALCVFSGGRAVAGPLFLEMETDNSRIFLLGSIHFAGPAIYPLPDSVLSAFHRSDTLVLEVDDAALDPGTSQALMREAALYPAGDSLRAHLSSRTLEALNKRGVDIDAVDHFRPWFLGLTLTMQELAGMGYSPAYGVDRYFAALAAERGIPVVGLESMEEQMQTLSTLSQADGDVFMRMTLNDLDRLPKAAAALVQAWKQGDETYLRRELIEPLQSDPEYGKIYEALIASRNRKMAERLAGLLREGGTYFVVVGTAHLVGEGNVAELLLTHGARLTPSGK